MGLNLHTLRFLLEARDRGASFETVATIGRLGLFVDPPMLRRTLAEYGTTVSAEEIQRIVEGAEGFCEPLLQLLGASAICSIDVSAYQGATVVHDMNEPISETFKAKFSLVIDGGSLEHVFNFPRAIQNCMEMVRTGGRFIGISPTNNLMGHGFYQFSPELYFRVFSAGNGFVTERMVIFQDCWRHNQWHEVRDPAEVRRRVTLVNRHPTHLLIQAQRRDVVSPFASTPQQSDYVTMWNDSSASGSLRPSAIMSNERNRDRSMLQRLAATLKRLVPASIKRRYHVNTDGDPFDPELYRKVGS